MDDSDLSITSNAVPNERIQTIQSKSRRMQNEFLLESPTKRAPAPFSPLLEPLLVLTSQDLKSMDSLSLTAAVAAISLLAIFTTPCHSATPTTSCTSQSFSNNRSFSLCSNLPHLSSSLFWTYYPSNSTASIAFVAPPAQPTGWIAWAINPTATGMIGSQALIAFQSNGLMKVQTFNITGYGPVQPSPISINVSDLSAVFDKGLMMIFATVTLPQNKTTWNQVWQVGSTVTNGLPDKHAFATDNLNAKQTLDFLKGATSGTGTGGQQNGTVSVIGKAPASAPSPSSPSSSPTPSFSPRRAIYRPSFMMGLVLFVIFICSV
ncbi:auxin-induced in root cultures protein 12-like [Magnolia sinica]|uniref:auxin-induced in root cultures protein 12-like n=1 Tax=Magnolia sinica TaxID=86752 RepID=UPI0026594553|nr:auxin-induced in root cultures protein 12-like [Magnolia sinica]